jgi:uncharacterized protein (TIRG00374 family)
VRKSAQWLVGLAISLLAFGLAFRGAHLGDVLAALRQANYFYILPVIALIYVGQMARAMSWHTLLNRPIPFARVFGALNAGYLLNNVLPFRLGELGRAYLIGRSQPNLRATHALSTVLVERLLDLLLVLLMMTAFLPQVMGVAQVREAALASLVIGAVALTGMLVVAHQRALVLAIARWVLARVPLLNGAHWEARVGAFVDGLAPLQNIRHSLTAAFWSALAWLGAGLATWTLMLGFLPHATMPMAFFVLIVTALGIAVPSAPAGAGVFEYATVLALSAFHVDASLAFSYAVVLHACYFLLLSGLGMVELARAGETVVHLAAAAQELVASGEHQ